jgi:hypothetical protein
LELYGGFVLNLPNGGANPAGVEFMATQIRGEPGRVVSTGFSSIFSMGVDTRGRPH